MTVCLICARHGRHQPTGLDTHCCATCATRISDDLTAIPTLAINASTEPRTGRGQGRTVPASRPPIDLSGVDPALTTVTVGSGPTTVLEVLEQWCRIVREDRGLSPWGPASVARAGLWERRRAAFSASGYQDTPRTSQAGYAPHATTVTLIGAVTDLRANLAWIIAQPWVDDYADEVRACVRALRRYDADHDGATVVPCPTEDVHGQVCGKPLRVAAVSDYEDVTCPRCRVNRTTAQLLRIGIDVGDAWVDSEAAATACGVTESTLRRWARIGTVRRDHGRYSLADVRAAADAEARRRTGS